MDRPAREGELGIRYESSRTWACGHSMESHFRHRKGLPHRAVGHLLPSTMEEVFGGKKSRSGCRRRRAIEKVRVAGAHRAYLNSRGSRDTDSSDWWTVCCSGRWQP